MSSRDEILYRNHIVTNRSQDSEIGSKRLSVEGRSWGPFIHIRSPEGVSVFAPETSLAIILLESVRNLRWKNEDGEELASSCTAGTVLIIPAHKGTAIIWPESIEILKVVLQPDQDTLRDQPAITFPLSDPPGRIIDFSSKQCLQIVQLVLEQLREDTIPDDYYLKSLHYVLIYLLAKNAMIACSTSGAQPVLSSFACRQIESYLKENFRNEVSVPDMAALIGVSAGHFSICFRESFGLTPHQYLMGLRLNEALKYLVETDIPISEVAARLCFSSQSHLTTTLKKHCKITPGEARRRRNQSNFLK
ncbi:AraC family transcriptional regulator [Brucella sp. 21LCYQ03]|nr:AraC family transcriptional regulator [Brucella sp. 21LCYQ03]